MSSIVRHIVILAGLLLATGAAAGEVEMASGSVSFHTPDNWITIMEVQGNPEVRVFQVPDPSPTAASSLARVTVTVKPVSDVGGFQRYMDEATAKARQLTAFTETAGQAGLNSLSYTARENGVRYAYSERYWFGNNHAIQLRCARPMESEAGSAWTDAFDRDCSALAAQLKP